MKQCNRKKAHHINNALELSVSRDELMLLYQPRVNLTTMTTECVEALVRWRHPTWGIVMPESSASGFYCGCMRPHELRQTAS